MDMSYTFIFRASHVLCMNLQACTTNATLQLVKMHTNSVTLCPSESLRYLNQFQSIPHNVSMMYNSFYVFSEKHLTFSIETHGSAIFPPNVRQTITTGIKKELIRVLQVIFQDQPMTRLILSTSTKPTFCRLTTTKNI